jgi:hypothetical protein
VFLLISSYNRLSSAKLTIFSFAFVQLMVPQAIVDTSYKNGQIET